MVKRGPTATETLARLGLVTALAAAALAYCTWRTGSFSTLWWTPDQHAQRLYDELEFSQAADRFDDPHWKGIALADAGRYEEAAATFGRIPSAVGFFNRGNAFLKGREYRQAITAYEFAVAEAPDWPEAQQNLELARYVLAYIERTREQSDTGDESELSADDFKFDNTTNKGVEITIDDTSRIDPQSAEKWMRAVDTKTRDYLRIRFGLEASRKDQR